jgi:hypothetical protein
MAEVNMAVATRRLFKMLRKCFGKFGERPGTMPAFWLISACAPVESIFSPAQGASLAQ